MPAIGVAKARVDVVNSSVRQPGGAGIRLPPGLRMPPNSRTPPGVGRPLDKQNAPSDRGKGGVL